MLRSDLQTPDIPTLYSVNFYYSRKPATCSDMLIISVKNERLLLGLGQQLVARSQRTSAPVVVLQNCKYHIAFEQLPEHGVFSLIFWI